MSFDPSSITLILRVIRLISHWDISCEETRKSFFFCEKKRGRLGFKKINGGLYMGYWDGLSVQHRGEPFFDRSWCAARRAISPGAVAAGSGHAWSELKIRASYGPSIRLRPHRLHAPFLCTRAHLAGAARARRWNRERSCILRAPCNRQAVMPPRPSPHQILL